MFQFPLKDNALSTRFIHYSYRDKNGVYHSTMHYGIDIICSVGTPCYAANDGKCFLSTWDSAGGNMIGILGSGELSRYAHLNQRLISVGQTVKRGDLIGYTGNTGSATTGAHLHFETWLVPEGYKYSYADRTKYAVDPMSVCHLLAGQTFNNRGLATMSPIPYPEPKPESYAPIAGVVRVTDGAVRLRLIPEVTKYQYIVGGNNRAYDTLAKLVSGNEFIAAGKATNDGYDWALINTERGQFWVSLLAGKTELVGDTPTEPTDDELKKENEELKAEVKTLSEANDILKKSVANLNSKISAAVEILS